MGGKFIGTLVGWGREKLDSGSVGVVFFLLRRGLRIFGSDGVAWGVDTG